jgi:hypothetical protein
MVRRQQKPAGVMVIAILQIVFGSLGLLGPVLYFAGAQRAMASWQASMPKAPNQPDFSQENLQAAMEQRLPGYTAYMNGLNGLALVMCLMMIAGGIGLLQMQPWARWLTVVWAALSIAYTVGNTVFSLTTVVPLMMDIMSEQIQRMQPAGPGPGGPGPEVLLSFMRIGMIVGAVFALILLAYPITVLIILLLPSSRAAFRGQPVAAEPEDYRDADWGADSSPVEE